MDAGISIPTDRQALLANKLEGHLVSVEYPAIRENVFEPLKVDHLGGAFVLYGVGLAQKLAILLSELTLGLVRRTLVDLLHADN